MEFLASSHEVVSFMCTFSLTCGTDGILGFEVSEPLIDPDGYCRVVASSKDEEVEGNVSKKSVQSVLTHLYPKDYTKPTMEEALTEEDLTAKQVEMIFNVRESLQMKGGCLKEDYSGGRCRCGGHVHLRLWVQGL